MHTYEWLYSDIYYSFMVYQNSHSLYYIFFMNALITRIRYTYNRAGSTIHCCCLFTYLSRNMFCYDSFTSIEIHWGIAYQFSHQIIILFVSPYAMYLLLNFDKSICLHISFLNIILVNLYSVYIWCPITCMSYEVSCVIWFSLLPFVSEVFRLIN